AATGSASSTSAGGGRCGPTPPRAGRSTPGSASRPTTPTWPCSSTARPSPSGSSTSPGRSSSSPATRPPRAGSPSAPTARPPCGASPAPPSARAAGAGPPPPARPSGAGVGAPRLFDPQTVTAALAVPGVLQHLDLPDLEPLFEGRELRVEAPLPVAARPEQV